MNIFKKIGCIASSLYSKIESSTKCKLLGLFVGLLVSILCDYTLIYIFLSLTFIVLRNIIGGYYCKTLLYCVITTNVALCFGSLAAEYTYQLYEVLWFVAMAFGVFVMPICPKNFGCEHTGILCRKKYRTALLLCLLASASLVYARVYELSVAIDYGIILASVFVSDSGEKVLTSFWRFLE
jgi:hypothetical protein